MLTLRCLLDGLLLPAYLDQGQPPLIAIDGDEAFALEAVEAMYYELVEATAEEVLDLERRTTACSAGPPIFRPRWNEQEASRGRQLCLTATCG